MSGDLGRTLSSNLEFGTMRWSLRMKLTLAMLGTSMLFLIAVGVGYRSISSVADAVEADYQKAVVANEASAYAFNMRVSQAQNALAGRFISNPDGSNMHVGDVAQFNDALGRLRKLASTPLDRRSLKAVDALYAKWKSGDARGSALWQKGDIANSTAWELGEENTRGDKLSTALFDYTTALSKAAVAAKAGDVSNAKTAMTLAVILAALFAGVLIFLLTRSIARRVGALSARLDSLSSNCVTDLQNGLEAVAGGDLTVPVEPVTEPMPDSGTDELGALARTFNAMLDNMVSAITHYNQMRTELSAVLGEVSSSAGTVAAASEQMAASSEEAGRAVAEIAHAVGDVAHGAERQVTAVEHARAGITEAARAAGASAETASGTAAATGEAQNAAREGAEAAGAATTAIQQIADSSAHVNAEIQALSAKSERIGGIVDTITGIAEQTNLLALNAAIEAARAGEQGRGFAVVAEEVRKLAEESQSAAGEISELIAEIQQGTDQVAAVGQESAERTREGVATVERAREAFEQISAAVEEVTAKVNEIALSAQQISEETTRMETDINEVAAVAEGSSASAEEVSASTEETSASTQEIAHSATELAGTAEHLAGLIGRFKIMS